MQLFSQDLCKHVLLQMFHRPEREDPSPTSTASLKVEKMFKH